MLYPFLSLVNAEGSSSREGETSRRAGEDWSTTACSTDSSREDLFTRAGVKFSII